MNDLSQVARACKAAYTIHMRQYERYVLTHLLWPTVMITASLTGLVWLTQIMKFLDFILSRGLTLIDFLYLTGLMLPSLLLIITPIALGIATIYTYNKLMVESELIVLSSVGVSKWQLAKPALVMGAAAAGICLLLALYVMPVANAKFQDIRVFFRDKYASVLLEDQVFNNPLYGVTVYIRERDEKNNLFGIVMHDSRGTAGQTVTMIADRGRFEQTASGPRFHLQQGMRQEWKNGRVGWLKFDDYAIDLAFYGADVNRDRGASERTIGELFKREGLNDKQAAAYRAEAHQRLTWPLMAASLPLFVLALLFTSEFNRRGQMKRIMVASLGMVFIMIIYFAFRSLSVKQGWAIGGLYVLTLGVGLLSLRLLGTHARAPRAKLHGGVA